MEVTQDLRSAIRSSIREHLALLADPAMQREYQLNVPIADVPAELFCIWFDDVYHPDSPAHRQAFTPSELAALDRFNALFDRVGSRLREVRDLAELQARPEWSELAAAAEEVLREIPPELPDSPLQRA